ncbi:MAG TPA: DUF1937 family protein [Thermoguttaceae bacterium]|nr:DUF1937 family protein [Thermoguttaceae bacterium]
MIYLASPYSDPNPAIREQRFRIVCQVAAAMLRAGALVFSPIAHSIPIAEHGTAPNTWAFWKGLDLEMLARSDEVVVLKLPGWDRSQGVQAEVVRARALGKPVSYVEAGDVTGRAGRRRRPGPPMGLIPGCYDER